MKKWASVLGLHGDIYDVSKTERDSSHVTEYYECKCHSDCDFKVKVELKSQLKVVSVFYDGVYHDRNQYKPDIQKIPLNPYIYDLKLDLDLKKSGDAIEVDISKMNAKEFYLIFTRDSFIDNGKRDIYFIDSVHKSMFYKNFVYIISIRINIHSF